MKKLGHMAVVCVLTAMVAAPVVLADSSASRIKDCPAGDWCAYNRSHLGWRHSPLDQINTGNVGQLRPAWMFQPGKVPMGLISTPLAIDGMIYLPVNPSTVWKLDGATGERIWVYVPEMDDAIISRTFFAHTRGVTIGDGRVYMGQADGRIVALDEQTGEVMWDQQIVDSKKDTAGFSGGGSFVNSDLLVIGQNGGEYPVEGRIFGLDPKTGDVKWTFYTTGRDDPHALATWGGDTWKYGGGGSWQSGTVDYENNQIFFGTGNPNPDFDYCGSDCLDVNADAYRPGANLYTSSTVALDLDTGKLNWYFQEAPSDPYDYDSSPGEYVLFESNGQKLVLHVGKNGFYHVHDRKSGKPMNVYPNTKAINWTTGFNLETGEWENMLWPEAGKKTLVCPHIEGGHSWNAGAYNPDTGLFYRVAQEWCMWLTIAKEGGQDAVTIGATTRITEPFAQPFMSATWGVARPPSPDDPTKEGTENYHAFITARDPLTGETAWERRYDIVPHSALLSTAGGLIFNGTYDGYAEALDARNGDVLWRFNTGSGHNGGIISYEANGRQYVAVVSGHGSYVGGGIAAPFADKLLHYEQSAALVAFELP
jgi:PQQ-dependent dehydrogenase (methanol/ethanol family)